MAELEATTVTGKVTAGVGASEPNDLMRKGEVDAGLATKAALAHTHLATDVTDLADAVQAGVGDWVGALGGDLEWQGLSGVAVRLGSNGGLTHAAGGLAVDAGRVSLVGHTHAVGDVTGWAAALAAVLAGACADSETVGWTQGSAGMQAAVRLRASGGLLAGSGGLAVDFGTGAAQVAAGAHTHAQLHDAVTVQSSASLALSLAGQQLTGAVRLAATGGLIALDGGLAVDLGTGATQAAAGDHGHLIGAMGFGSGGVAGWASEWLGESATIGWTAANGTLAPGVRLEAGPVAGHAALGVASGGLYVPLGTGTGVAAEGSHGHAAATTDAPGFLSTVDKARLDALAGALVQSVTAPLQLAGGVLSVTTGAAVANAVPVSDPPTAAEINGVVAQFNALLTSLRTAGLMAA